MIDAPPPDFRLLRFSTDRIGEDERFDLWRDVLTRKLLRVAIDPLDGAFAARVMMRAQHGFRIGIGEIGATISRRTREVVAADNDDLALMVNLGGAFTLVRRGEQLSLGAGDATLVSCSELGDVVRPTRGRQLCLRLPRGPLAALFPDIEALTGRLIPRATDALALLTHHVNYLFEDDDTAMSPGASEVVVRHIGDLVALIVGDARPAIVEAASGGLRAARMTRIRGLIAANMGRENLSADHIATAIGVSGRYVRRLFEQEGESFSNFLARQRLERAYVLLTSPAAMHMSIATIAFEVGFGDLSYFNRRFRRAFSTTPSEVRAEAVAARAMQAQGPLGVTVSI